MVCNSGVVGAFGTYSPVTMLLGHLDTWGFIGGAGLDLVVSPRPRSTFDCCSWVHSAQSHLQYISDHRKTCNIALQVCRGPSLENYVSAGMISVSLPCHL